VIDHRASSTESGFDKPHPRALTTVCRIDCFDFAELSAVDSLFKRLIRRREATRKSGHELDLVSGNSFSNFVEVLKQDDNRLFADNVFACVCRNFNMGKVLGIFAADRYRV
jgi:hypothetical protein